MKWHDPQIKRIQYHIWLPYVKFELSEAFFCHLFSGSKAVTEMYQRRDFSLNDTWEALFDRRLGQKVEVMVRIPSNAPVGKEMFRAMFGLNFSCTHLPCA